MRCKNCNRMRWDGYEDGEYLCKIFGYGDDLDENGKRYIFENSKGEEGCKYTEKQLQKIEKQIREAELEYLRKEDEMFYKRNREKLDKIEKIEDELGCPLEVVFEALDKGIIINEKGFINTAYEHKKFEEEDSYYDNLQLYKSNNGYYFEETDSPYGDLGCGLIGCEVTLKDYQKTWWLPSDKEWKDE